MKGDKRHLERRRNHLAKLGDAADYRLIRDNLYVGRYVGRTPPEWARRAGGDWTAEELARYRK